MTKGTVLDLFCGAGGASLGFLQAGYEVRGAVDIDDEARDIYKQNICDEGLVDFEEPVNADLETATVSEILDELDNGLEKDDIDVICGCPPCQNFSKLRDTEPWPDGKPKDTLLRAFVDRIREVKPDIVFFENVSNIMNAGDEEPTTYVDWFRRQMHEMTRQRDNIQEGGYGVSLEVVNAANYGVPQRRRRTIGICIYGVDDGNVKIPAQTHSEDANEDDELDEWVTVGETLDREDLCEEIGLGKKQKDIDGYPDDPGHRSRRHQTKTVEMMEAIREHGDSWRDLEDTDDEDLIKDCHTDVEGGAGSAYGIMQSDEPAPTLTTRCTTPSSGRFTHPEENRAITFREAALLMTFPRWFSLPEKNGAAERVIGNAVPPKLVQSIVSQVNRNNENNSHRQIAGSRLQ